ncbi:MAG TPA: hypothetical protein VHS78_16905 [Candidatus Elarobacter sp.]|jgi:hypothetical protein|nr:hypothetical protein [Candidatus Elarobacter sp.]
MTEREIVFSQTYTPGKNLGGTRQVTVDGIPAREVADASHTNVHFTFDVADRIEALLQRALDQNDLQEQRITYTASD